MISSIGRFTPPSATSSAPRAAGRTACRYQVVRLASFGRWSLLGKLSPLTFSNAGFYCADAGDTVTCFCCGLTLGQWTADMRPSAAHAKLSGGQCAFVNDPDHSGNVVIGTPSAACTVIARSRFRLTHARQVGQNSSPYASCLQVVHESSEPTSLTASRRRSSPLCLALADRRLPATRAEMLSWRPTLGANLRHRVPRSQQKSWTVSFPTTTLGTSLD